MPVGYQILDFVRIGPACVVGVALVCDWLVGEPPQRIHPVALFGRLIAWFDREWPAPRFAGLVFAVVAPVSYGAVGAISVAIALQHSPVGGIFIAGGILWTTISLRRLIRSAEAVIEVVDADPVLARERLPALVGRDPTALSVPQIRSAVVESLAENCSDGFVAPLLGFGVAVHVSVPVGVAVALWVKAVNTLDSMLGYHAKPHGWASARLDDVVMWIPARLTAILLAVTAGDLGALGRARPFHQEPPSPNAGWPMATMGTILDVRLEKPDTYTLVPTARLPDTATAIRATSVVRSAGVLAGLVTIAVALGSGFVESIIFWAGGV